MTKDNESRPTAGTQLFELTTRVVSSYASKSALSLSELVAAIGAVYRALSIVGDQPTLPIEEGEFTPAVPVKKSVSTDFIVCLEDGKRFKMLKRHLMTVYGMTPAEYRAKWRLPHDYPMIAPAYSATRSAVAKASGLGKTVQMERPPAPIKLAAKRGRPRKSSI